VIYTIKDLFEMIQRVERRVGNVYSTSMSTITGEIHHLRENILLPQVEKDIPISGDNFTVLFPPMLLGEGYAIGGHVTISMFDTGTNSTVIHKWRDVTFNGITGTINGADGAYDGKHVTLSYYHKDVVFYKFSIDDENIQVSQVLEPEDDIILEDSITGLFYCLKVTEHGFVDTVEVESTSSSNTILTDEVSGTQYQLFMIDGYLSYEEI